MWEVHNPIKTQSLPRTATARFSEKFGPVPVKTNYKSYRDFLQSFNENKTGFKDDQESVSSVDSGISSYKLSESKSNNNSSSSVNSEGDFGGSTVRRSDVNGLKSSFGSYKEFLENYNNKRFSSVKPTLTTKKNVVKSEIFIQVGDENETEKTDSVGPDNGVQVNGKETAVSSFHIRSVPVSPVVNRKVTLFATRSSSVNNDKVNPAHDGKISPIEKTSIVSSGISSPNISGKTSPVSNGKVSPASNGKTSPISNGKISPISSGKISPISSGKVSPISSGKVSPISSGKSSPIGNGKSSPLSNEQVDGKESPTRYGNVSPINKLLLNKFNDQNPSVNGSPSTDKPPKRSNNFSNGRTVETIKKFNDLIVSNKDNKNVPAINGTLGRSKGRFSNGKPEVVPERSSFINGRTSPENTLSSSKKEEIDNKVVEISSPKIRENGNINGITKVERPKMLTAQLSSDKIEIEAVNNGKSINSNGKNLLNSSKEVLQSSGEEIDNKAILNSLLSNAIANGKFQPNGKVINGSQATLQTDINVSQNENDIKKLNIKQISEELNKINARFLNGEMKKDLSEKKTSSTENLDECETSETDTSKNDSMETPPKSPTSVAGQTMAIPPPPPPPPPMLNMDGSLSTISRKWDKVKTGFEKANMIETSKPKETNRAAMDLAKVLTEGRRLRKTKSVDDTLESETSPTPTCQNGFSERSKQTSSESLQDQPQSLPYTATLTLNAGGRHNNYLKNKERTPSPPRESPKSVYSGKACAKVSITPCSTLPRTMSGSDSSSSSSSILEANTKTVVPVTDRNARIEKGDPNVKKLVYNTYRGLLGAYNNKANDMIATLPRNMVREDRGVSKQLESISLQGGLEKLNGRINPNNVDKD